MGDAMLVCRIDESLELRLLEPHHAAELYTVVDANREHLREWLPWVDASRSAEHTRGFIHGSLLRFAEREAIVLGIWVEGRIAGVIEGRTDEVNLTMDIGYWLAREATGRGAASKACQALIRYGFEERGLRRVQIRCAAGNARSCALAERLGFALEGVNRQALRVGSRWLDQKVYAVLASDWKAVG
jgi:ribosomal-protein-serine acetyltransferase